jgi:tellurite resistance protein TehA-like permease
MNSKKVRNDTPATMTALLKKVINIKVVITPNWFLSYFFSPYKVVLFPQLDGIPFYLSRIAFTFPFSKVTPA